MNNKQIGTLVVIALTLAGITFVAALALPVQAQGVGERVSTTVRDTEQTLRDAGQSAADQVEQLWLRLDERRLKNRTRDEIVAWLIMGCLVGSLTVTLGLFKSTTGGRLLAFALGLIGAFIGGIIVHLGRIDFGMGPVLIRYEDLGFALAGAVVLLLVPWFFTRRRAKSAR